MDSDERAANPHLDFVLADIARTIADLRAAGKTVLVHCVAAEQRTPSAALAFSRHHGQAAAEAGDAIARALRSTRGAGRLWDRAGLVAASSLAV